MITPAKTAILLCLIAGAFLAGYTISRWQAPANPSSHSRQVLYYTCPMHPQYRSGKPGDAPCCGMRLEPVYADQEEAVRPSGAPEPPGTVGINLAQQQLMGVRLGTVEESGFSHAMRYPGRVVVDETRVHRWNAAVDGWIRFVSPDSTGSLVKQGALIATFYAPEFLGAEQSYIFGLASWERFQATGKELPAQINAAKVALQQSADSLRSLGMSETQIAEMAKNQATTENIKIFSPVTGFIITRNVSPGQRFDKGTELYRFADLGRVWVMADVFEKDRELIRPGAMATVRYQGRSFSARMSDVLPQFDPTTRTLKTRFEVENPALILRPDMFVDVEVRMNLPATVHIPVEAILDTGARQTVYVDRSDGFFEARQVRTGWRLGDQAQISAGLQAGERIVMSGTFLIDSESRMRLAAASALPRMPIAPVSGDTARDVVCNMDVDPASPAVLKTDRQRTTYYFCSPRCKTSFEQNPGKYLPKEQGRPPHTVPSTQTARGPA